MARYPNWGVGMDVSADNLALGIPNIFVKAATETISNDATLTDDAELAAIPLPVGTFKIELLILATSANATPDIKTRWTFSGTWNNPVRACVGPSSANTANPDGTTPMRLQGLAAGTDMVYGLGNHATPYVIIEKCYTVVVTVAGNLAFQWAQNTATVANTAVTAGSAFEIKQLA